MQIRFHHSPAETTLMNTEALREHFLVQNLFVKDKIQLVYSHYDRVIIGGVMPVSKTMVLQNEGELKADYFLQRREMGIINIGAKGIVTADGKKYILENKSCIYLGKGTKKISFETANKKAPALFYILSAPAHTTYPNTLYTKEQAAPVQLGAADTCNKRTVYKYIHTQGIKSCQLVMGLTVLETGSVWNSIPPHTHTRRMEVYMYFDVPPEHRVMHFMGEPQQTRHLIMANNEAVISPSWSTHYGCGTINYGFIWGMAGENLDYTDMDAAPVATLL